MCTRHASTCENQVCQPRTRRREVIIGNVQTRLGEWLVARLSRSLHAKSWDDLIRVSLHYRSMRQFPMVRFWDIVGWSWKANIKVLSSVSSSASFKTFIPQIQNSCTNWLPSFNKTVLISFVWNSIHLFRRHLCIVSAFHTCVLISCCHTCHASCTSYTRRTQQNTVFSFAPRVSVRDSE